MHNVNLHCAVLCPDFHGLSVFDVLVYSLAFSHEGFLKVS
jgi:hypothetical protein